MSHTLPVHSPSPGKPKPKEGPIDSAGGVGRAWACSEEIFWIFALT